MPKNKVELYGNWRTLLRKAWTVRLFILIALISALEEVIPILQEHIDWRLKSLAVFVLSLVGVWARLLKQKAIDAEDEK